MINDKLEMIDVGIVFFMNYCTFCVLYLDTWYLCLFGYLFNYSLKKSILQKKLVVLEWFDWQNQ